MNQTTDPLIKAAVLCVPLYYVYWRFIFGSWDEFLDALRFWFTPNWLSLLRGELGDDLFAGAKMLFFLLC